MGIVKCVTYNGVLNEMYRLRLSLDYLKSKIELTNYNMSKSPKWLRWLFKSDLDEYNSIYSRKLYRYSIICKFKHNFYKFVTGVSKKDYKNTKKLADLLDKLKLAETVDNLVVNFKGMEVALRDLRVRVGDNEDVNKVS